MIIGKYYNDDNNNDNYVYLKGIKIRAELFFAQTWVREFKFRAIYIVRENSSDFGLFSGHFEIFFSKFSSYFGGHS